MDRSTNNLDLEDVSQVYICQMDALLGLLSENNVPKEVIDNCLCSALLSSNCPASGVEQLFDVYKYNGQNYKSDYHCPTLAHLAAKYGLAQLFIIYRDLECYQKISRLTNKEGFLATEMAPSSKLGRTTSYEQAMEAANKPSETNVNDKTAVDDYYDSLNTYMVMSPNLHLSQGYENVSDEQEDSRDTNTKLNTQDKEIRKAPSFDSINGSNQRNSQLIKHRRNSENSNRFIEPPTLLPIPQNRPKNPLAALKKKIIR
ncbi:DgyrCDS12418 [Dimorphilus gyrociliatus]|uniref:DgyrCDS12418 n=1 Tax=Dimorphilus gyrociliatus TaxID=2664684 RepID=A0A7I8W7M0_9ANNE|nr:DgyrCDS12418 [Dimorphilus gyrociliatus]